MLLCGILLLPNGRVFAQHVVGGAVVDLHLIDDILDVVVGHHLGDGVAGVPGIHPIYILVVVNEEGDEGVAVGVLDRKSVV